MTWLKRNWVIAAFLVFLPLLPLWKTILGGEALGAFDQIAPMGWAPNAIKSPHPWDVLQADSVLQFYVWRDLVFQAWGRGEIPFWNPYELCGTPLMANSQSAALYPPHIIMGVLHVPTPVAMTLLAWFHLSLAGFGIYALAKQLGASDIGAAAGGGLFSVSAFMVSWATLPSVISTVAWIPWALCFTHRSFGNPRAHKTIGALMLTVGMMILAGHLQFVAYGFIAITVTIAVLALQTRDYLSISKAVLALALGVCIAAPQLLPVLNFSQFSHRRNSPSEEGYAAFLGGALGATDVLGIAFPEAVGNPQEYLGDDPTTNLSSYWPILFKRGGNFAEGAIGIGALTVLGLGLLVWAPNRLRNAASLAAVAIVGLLISLGSPLNRLFYFAVPGWSATGSPGRSAVLFVLAACVMAAFGFSFRPPEAPKEKWIPYLPVGGLMLILAITVMALQTFTGQPLPGIKAEIAQTVFAIATASAKSTIAMKGVVVVLLAGYMIYDRMSKPWLWLVGVAIFACPPFGFSARTSPPLTARTVESLPHERVAIIQSAWDIIQPASAVFPPNLATLLGVREVGGYDSLIHRDTVAVLREIDGEDPAPAANGNMMFIKPRFDKEKLRRAGVVEAWLPDPKTRQFFRVPVGGHRVENARPGETAASPVIISESLNTIKVRATDSFLLHDRYMPGWTAAVEGQEVQLPDSTWRLVEFKSDGKPHEIVFSYVPPGFKLGLAFLLLPLAWMAWMFAIRPKGLRMLAENATQ